MRVLVAKAGCKTKEVNMRQGCLTRMLFAVSCLVLTCWGIAHAGGKVKLLVDGQGTVTVGGFKMQNGQTKDFPGSSTLMISATPKDPNWFFNGWSIIAGPSTLDNPGLPSTEMKLKGDTVVKVEFCTKENATYKITIQVIGNGMVVADPCTISGPSGTGTLAYSTPKNLVIAAYPSGGAVFLGWTGSAVGNGKVNDPCSAVTTVRVDGDYYLYANFKGGSISPPEPKVGKTPSAVAMYAAPVGWYKVNGLDKIAATLWGMVQEDGGKPCDWRFKYKRQADPDWAWTFSGWSSSPQRRTGQDFNEVLPDLRPNTTYVFAVQVKNSDAQSQWSEIKSFTTPAVPPVVLYVDDDAASDPGPGDPKQSDPMEDGSVEHPFDSIQEAINAASGTTIIVCPGIYTETIDLKGKNVTIKAQWLEDKKVTKPSIIEGVDGAPVVTFASGESAECVLAGLTITGGREAPGVWINGASPTLKNCLIVGNGYNGILCQDSAAAILNCTIAGNRAAGLACVDSAVMVLNSIIWGNASQAVDVSGTLAPVITYSDIQGGWSGDGNIDLDPRFADPGYWLDLGTPMDQSDDIWVYGDYHLRSSGGRFWPILETWVQDKVDSPCIDAGSPASDASKEPAPSGGVVNMGAYGGTSQASKS